VEDKAMSMAARSNTRESTEPWLDRTARIPTLLLPAAAIFLCPALWPRWAWMWLIVAALLAGWKWLTWWDARRTEAPWWLHVGYLVGWPGLDARAFLCRVDRTQVTRPGAGELLWYAGNTLLGAALVWGAVRLVPAGWNLAAGWVGMVGLAFLAHFGAFGLLSWCWRAAGIEARPLMDCPIAAGTVSEFWGRRWNTAFRDLAHRYLFRPLTARLGPVGGLLAAFLFSGLVHELAISVPAGGGYGLPTAYFLIQGAGLLAERSAVGRRAGLGRGWRGRAFAVLVVLGPVALLFHRPFVEEIVVPFLAAIGAGPC
jgi:hypothetical protein